MRACLTSTLLLFLLPSLAESAISSASVRNGACSFLHHDALPANSSQQLHCISALKRLLDELGPPTSDGERFIAYLTAIQEYCTALSGDATLCNSVPFCRTLLPDLDGRPFSEILEKHDRPPWHLWYQSVAGEAPRKPCWPDWMAVLTQPCEGSPQAQMQHCFQNRPLVEPCPAGCNLLSSNQSLVFQRGFCNTADCWPPWVLKQLCDGPVQEHLKSVRTDFCAWGSCGRCQQTPPAECRSSCIHEACAVAAHYVQSTSWHAFQGQCSHTSVVRQLLTAAPEAFAGEGCSVAQWLDSSTSGSKDDWMLQGKVCQGTYRQPVHLTRLVLNLATTASPAGRVWVDGLHQGTLRSGGLHWFGSTMQAALIDCPTGYHKMHHMLSQPLLSPNLLAAVLLHNSSWRLKMLEGSLGCDKPPCGNDVCDRVLGTTVSTGPDQDMGADQVQEPYEPHLVPRTTLAVMQNYCSQAFASGPVPSFMLRVQAVCGKSLEQSQGIAKQHAKERFGLALVWAVYTLALILGSIGLMLSWRLPRLSPWRRYGRSGFTWLLRGLDSFCQGMCPGPPAYHPGMPQVSTVLGQQQPQAATGSSWRAVLSLHNLAKVGQAVAYCADVGLDIWTLAMIAKKWQEFEEQALSGGSTGQESYSTQLRVRADYNKALLHWLVIVFIMQYSSGILLTLPPTLAAYGVFNYQRLHFSPGCCAVVCCTGAYVMFVWAFFFVGAWYIVVADAYMLLAMVGVSSRILQGNKLNLAAYTTLRFMCEGILEALPAALISTAVLNQQLLSEVTAPKELVGFWLSLLFSMYRIARELFKLMRLTHDLGAWCFSTAILDVVYHVQPQQSSTASGQPGVAAASHSAAVCTMVGAGPSNTGGKTTLGPVLTAPQRETGMSRDGSAAVIGAVPANLPQATPAAAGYLPRRVTFLQQRSARAAVATAAQYSSSSSTAGPAVRGSAAALQQGGCCGLWRAGCSGYPTVLAVYVYYCLASLAVYLLLVCSDITHPWLMSARVEVVQECDGAPKAPLAHCTPGTARLAGAAQNCTDVTKFLPPCFREKYTLLSLFQSLSKDWQTQAQLITEGLSTECVLPDLKCK